MIEYSIPGYNVEINTGKLNVNTHGGSLNSLNSPMVRNAIFDVASITKLYTQIIDYNLIREGYYQQDMIVSDLHPDFKNATNLSIKMLKQFNFSYNINGNIDNVNSEDKAKEILYTLKVKEKVPYVYIDYGMMCLKEVMEKVTGKTYEQLVEDYITSKLKLSDTHLIVPEHKRELVTGTPNAHLGKNNDMKAIKLGGYSGHSGIMTNSDNLIKVVKNLYTNRHFFPLEHLSDVYTESEGSIYDDYCRGIMGNACTAGGSFVGKYAPLSTSSYQGSTRTQATTGVYNGVPVSSTILLNPCSMRLQKAQEFEEKIGRKIITEYGYYGKNYTQVASQVIIPTKVVKSLNDKMSEVSLKLAFLTTLINSTEKEYQGAIDIEMENRTLVKKI